MRQKLRFTKYSLEEFSSFNGPAKILSSAHNKFHFLTLYLIHFPTPYLLSSIHLSEGRAVAAWEPSNPQSIVT
jgi:hypothetical protein